MIYAFHFASDPGGAEGYIYLPGADDLHYRTKIGTILRGGEGKWHYASPEWTALMGSLLAESGNSGGKSRSADAVPAGPPMTPWVAAFMAVALPRAAAWFWLRGTRKSG